LPKDDDMVDVRNRLEVIRKVAESQGAVLVEHFVCCRCGHSQQSIHLWLESLRCCRCGQMNASRIPRKPQKGEVTAEHLIQALRTYTRAYTLLLDGRDVTDLGLECERTISREDASAVKFALKTIERVAGLADKLAGQEDSSG
jgi:transcription elongation factor Elf1